MCALQPALSELSVSARKIFCLTAFILWTTTSAGKLSELQNNSYAQDSNLSIFIVGGVSAAAVVVILVYVLVHCTDCYKSEVSSDFHPATGHDGVKWGGAGGYAAAATSDVNDSVLGAGFAGEVVLPGDGGQQALPYTMIPSQVPESQGFRGYGDAPGGDAGLRGYSAAGEGQALAGYGGNGAGAAGAGGRSQNLPGAHTAPMLVTEPEEPPPSYFASTNR